MTRVLCSAGLLAVPFALQRVTVNTWQSYGKSVVVPLAYVVPRVCTRRRSRPRRGCTSKSKRTHRAGCQGYIKPPSVPAAASPRPAQRPGLVLIRFVPCLHPPCALVGLDGRPPSSRDFAWPRCFAHAWPFQRRWVYAGYAQMIALAAPGGCHGTRRPNSLLFHFRVTEMSPAAERPCLLGMEWGRCGCVWRGCVDHDLTATFSCEFFHTLCQSTPGTEHAIMLFIRSTHCQSF